MAMDEAADQISGWLREYLTHLLGMPPGDIDDEQPFARLGLDSAAAIAMVGDLGTWLGCEIDAAVVYDYPNITALSRILAARPETQRSLRDQGASAPDSAVGE